MLQVTFSEPCSSGIGVGVAFDGVYLWYSCVGQTTDLYRADPRSGEVSATYSIEDGDGIGALAYDATRNAIWAGWGQGWAVGNVYLITLDDSHEVVSSEIVFNTGDHPIVCGLGDGLAFDGQLDDLFISDDCSTTIHRYDTVGNTTGNHIRDFPWIGSSCFSSGLALGGPILFQASADCARVYLVRKTRPTELAGQFATSGAPGVERDEDMECDPLTFAAEGKHVIWIRNAYEPVANAFRIKTNTCGLGGLPAAG